jgi:hypothetical protein
VTARPVYLISGQVGTVTKISDSRVRVKTVSGSEWWYDRPAVCRASLGIGSKVELTQGFKDFSDAARGPLKPGRESARCRVLCVCVCVCVCV